ncbi:16S rRNA (cytidine(1402)-2'-O)-methyltransferase [Kutzneria kofuensis]|uniref:Ribosomal RNA small subunit methyltransferase I n=1 Tax=Kutzneria kofuensis TaxID=103725 RepID=A0A7W9KG55_9PSEU|nr:16S rRNA (cytidine(1402)-2'-O)-methyltransferase [Kutzneria kofuensis]MBB5891822.1 16S rRNA (cytidine1402-2'-O)-methyltransferase [Kutzneria kofuensis]
MNTVSGTGRLLLAATPLGNLGDATRRLVDALATADLVAAEDTRKLRSLASGLGVTPAGKVVSFYDAVEAARLPGLVKAVASGQTVLLVTDAGMPSVSDPGYRLVAACVAEDLPITCLPGPSAVVTALALSGVPVDRFCFDGFPPRKPGERRKWLSTLASETRACVFFESPHRVAATLADAVEVLGADRRGAVCRQLTKSDEQVERGTLAELAEWAAGGVGGEVTVVFAGADPVAVDVTDVADLVPAVQQRVAAGQRLKDVVAEVAAAAGVSKKALYDSVVAAKK